MMGDKAEIEPLQSDADQDTQSAGAGPYASFGGLFPTGLLDF
jgi:hypothetical protein